MIHRLTSLVIATLVSLLLSACGTAHIRTDQQAPDLHNYTKAYIQKVDVYSREAAAKTNTALQDKMITWESFARNELESCMKTNSYTLITSEDQITADTLIVSLDVDLVYGNRAARYFGGFGAGKGSVDSTLIVSDPKTKEVKFKAVAASALSVGAFGGDMQGVLKSNIKKLIQQYPKKNP